MRRMTMLLLALVIWGAAGRGTAEAAGANMFVEEGAMDKAKAGRLALLLEREFGMPVELTFETEDTSLRRLILADDAPELAICAPQTVALWAEEGLTLSLEGCVVDQAHMQMEAVEACMLDGTMFMAPLTASHRLMAVNRGLLAASGLDGLLDARNHPVWLPMELQQVLEEMAFVGKTGMEIWPLTMETAGGVEAFVQALYGGEMIAEDGTAQPDDDPAVDGVRWLRDMVNAGLVGVAPDRETALERFLQGETALFVDWTAEEAARLDKGELDVRTVPHPSATGLPVRSFELTGIAAFATGDAAWDAQTREMVAFLLEDAQAQLILGGRNVWADGALWLTPLGADGTAAALRSGLCGAINAVIEGEQTPWQAMETLKEALVGR